MHETVCLDLYVSMFVLYVTSQGGKCGGSCSMGGFGVEHRVAY
jgi:hypothetical protein